MKGIVIGGIKPIFSTIPLPIWILLVTITLGISSPELSPRFLEVFNQNFIGSLGYFALLMIPSFLLARSLSKQKIFKFGKLTKILAPLAGASLICPDTAYVTLSSMSGNQKKSLALGAYAGFKLLPPAGPLLIMAALGLNEPKVFLYGILLLVPVWAVGELFVKITEKNNIKSETAKKSSFNIQSIIPLIIVGVLVTIGLKADLSGFPTILKHATQPAGALFIGAIYAWLGVPNEEKRECLESALSQTGRLLLLIGLATAFGKTLTAALPLTNLIQVQHPLIVIMVLFVIAAAFKIIQGSSMATFAATAPLALPIIEHSGLTPILAIFSIALGSMIAVLPNDTFYWIVKEDAYQKQTDASASLQLFLGTFLQGVAGLIFLYALFVANLI